MERMLWYEKEWPCPNKKENRINNEVKISLGTAVHFLSKKLFELGPYREKNVLNKGTKEDIYSGGE